MNDASGLFGEDDPAQTGQGTFQIVVLTKHDGPLTKKISLAADGSVHSDGSACRMSVGSGVLETHTPRSLAIRIAAMEPTEALALGAFADGVPHRVRIETKWSEAHVKFPDDSTRPPDLISRSAAHIKYRPGRPALALLDIDTKGMPFEVRDRINQLGGYWPALVSVLPELATTARVWRRSTTTGLSNIETGQSLPGSDGSHTFLLVMDGADVERFLKVMHQRCWLAGLGWGMVGAGGAFLRRSLIDTAVGLGERLVFEGAPLVVRPLIQDQSQRYPKVKEGSPLDTRAACPDLTAVLQAKLHGMESAEKNRLKPETEKRRAEFVDQHAALIVERTGCKPERARQIVERQCGGVLLPHVMLSFDDLGDVTVGEVLADPDRYVDETLADPLEGPRYGVCKGKVFRRFFEGSLWINSFAHGGMTYELKPDAAYIEQAIAAKPEVEAADILVEMAPGADINGSEEEHLREMASGRAKVGKASIKARIKAARGEAAQLRANEMRARREAERTDRRTRLPVPARNAPWLPVMQQLNEVLCGVAGLEPPTRDAEGWITQVCLRRVTSWHTLTSSSANDEEPKESRLPPTNQLLLTRLNEAGVAELIERYIEFYDPKTGLEVQLHKAFVEHFVHRPNDTALPVISGISTLPIVLANGTLLARQGLDRDRGVVFRIPEELLAILPTLEQCDEAAVKEAFNFLVDVFLVDVLTDITGKCVIIACALTLIERMLLGERPVFFVTAGRRGGGKTTLLVMLLMAITGVRPSAAAWSMNDEERRKALFSYLLEGPVSIIWDNIPRGTQISCRHIEKACTSANVEDRILGVSGKASVSTSPIHLFTGNNIGPKGEIASRALLALLEVLQPDPENRPFKHPQPIVWTEKHRGEILVALYTLMLGNPALRPGSNAAATAKTRFKDWYVLVGSTVEHAARLAGHTIDFSQLFLSQEDDEEETVELSSALIALHRSWNGGGTEEAAKSFEAADVTRLINNRESPSQPDFLKEDGITLLEFLCKDLVSKVANPVISAKTIGRRLKKHCGAPIGTTIDGKLCTLILRAKDKPVNDPHAATVFWLRIIWAAQTQTGRSPSAPSDPPPPPPSQDDVDVLDMPF
jgi:hypothetical protein